MTILTIRGTHLSKAHARLLERHRKHAEEIRSDILQIVQKNVPRQADMKARQERVDRLTDSLVNLMAGEYLDDNPES